MLSSIPMSGQEISLPAEVIVSCHGSPRKQIPSFNLWCLNWGPVYTNVGVLHETIECQVSPHSHTAQIKLGSLYLEGHLLHVCFTMILYMSLWQDIWRLLSLVPRPPPFLPSVCIHINTQEQKTSEKHRTGIFIMRVDASWTWGGEEPMFKCVRTKMKASFLESKTEVERLNGWSSALF